MSPTAVKTKRAFRQSVRVDVDINATPEKIWCAVDERGGCTALELDDYRRSTAAWHSASG